MYESSGKSDGQGPPNPYARDTKETTQPGVETVCELCETETLCVEQYGLTACRCCHHTLLPGRGVF